jgi:hypothetical protein
MSCIYRRPFVEAVRTIVHTIVTVAVMVGTFGTVGTVGTFGMFGVTVHASASEESPRVCSEVVGERHRLRVRLVPAKHVDARMMETVKTEVVELWRDYGVDVVWGGPWTGTEPEGPPDVFVHFVNRELEDYSRNGPSAVAWIRFVGGVPGNSINVSVAAADRLLSDSPFLDVRPMRHAPIDLQERMIATMIGRALAHEIGHYLLASSKHASEGLMRPMITPAQFVQIGRRHLKLVPEDVRALRAARLANCQLSASR